MLTCKYCLKEYDHKRIYSLRSHITRCKLNPNRVEPKIDYSKKKKSNAAIKAKEEGRSWISSLKGKKLPQMRRKHTDEFKQKQRENAINRKLGGVTQSRWIKYDGKTLGSSYELELAKDLNENNIKWDTCKRFSYIDPFGKKRTYTPDIYLVDFDIYLDPKNSFLLENLNPSLGFTDKIKIELAMQYNNIKVLILTKDELTWSCVKNKIADVL